MDKRLPYDILLDTPKPLYNPDDHAKLQLTPFQRIHQAVRSHLQESKDHMIARQHQTAQAPRFVVGDIVFIINHTRDTKLHPHNIGPFRITDKDKKSTLF